MGDHVRREMIVRITQVVRQNPAYRPIAHILNNLRQNFVGGCSLSPMIAQREYVKSLYRRNGWYLLTYLAVGCSAARSSPPAVPAPLPSSPVPQLPEIIVPTTGSWSFKYTTGTMNYQVLRSATIESQSDSGSYKQVSGNTTHELVTLDSTELGIGFTAVVDTFTTTTQGLISPVQPVELPIQISGSLVGDSLTISNQTVNDKCNPISSALITDLHNLLTHFPTQLSPGMRWRDSIQVSGCQAAIPTIAHIVRSYVVLGEVLYEGQPVIKIQRADTTKAHGEGGLQQHRVLLDANGTGNTTYYLDTTTGRILHLIIDQTLNLAMIASGKSYQFRQDSKQAFRLSP